MKPSNPLALDLDYILNGTKPVWPDLDGKTMFITGGTGFIGTWLLETLAYARRQYGLNLSIHVLTRAPDAFRKKAPHLALDKAITLQHGDIRSFAFPAIQAPYIIHGAAETRSSLYEKDPQGMLDTLYNGTARVLDFAQASHASHLLFISSGAVYGIQPPDIPCLDETYQPRLDPLNKTATYAIGKLAAEHRSLLYNRAQETAIKVARCYAFVGPYLALDSHFAIGNFIQDALSLQPIRVKGDGRTYRSYMYAADLVIWLLTILCFGERGLPYNVGSSEAISLQEVAALVAKQAGLVPPNHVDIEPHFDTPPPRYVPSVDRAKKAFGFGDGIALPDAIRKTIDWWRTHDNR